MACCRIVGHKEENGVEVSIVFCKLQDVAIHVNVFMKSLVVARPSQDRAQMEGGRNSD